MKKLILFSLLLASSITLANPMDSANLSAPLPSNIWVELSKLTQPGVVGIYVEVDRKMRQRYRDPIFDFIEEFLGPGFELETPDGEQKSSPIGTGFVIRESGIIVTNYHVVEPADNSRLQASLKVKVFGHDKLIPAKIIGKDPRGDLAILKIETSAKLKPLQFGNSETLKVGEYVAAFGNPYGHSNSMTVGIISAKGRAIKELNRFPFLQTDASINPGNSGGPLLNTKGYVIGVNTAIDARAQGVGFAIPSDYVKKIVSIIEKGQSIDRGYLGIGLATISSRAARSFGIKKGGVVVTDVRKNSPASAAGFKTYDIIVEFNNNKIKNSKELINQVQDAEIGKKVPVKILRSVKDGPYKPKTLSVAVGVFPKKGSAKPRLKKQFYQGQKAPYNLGFSITDSSSGARLNHNIPVNSPFGPIVNEVDVNSPASKAGLLAGDVILQVNRKEVTDAASAIKYFKKGSNNLLINRNKLSKVIFVESE